MAISYGQFTGWVSVSYVVKSEPSCTSHKPRASYQRWLVRGDLVHGICPHAATQSYIFSFHIVSILIDAAFQDRACGIDVPDSDNIVITGGFSGFTAKGLTRVVSYNTQGKATLLPSLQQQRYYHGCGYYYNNDEVVSCKLYIV